MKLKDGMWVACVLANQEKAVGIVVLECGALYINCITETGAVTTTRADRVESWCEIKIDWEEAE